MKLLIKISVLLWCLLASSLLPAQQWMKTYNLETYIGPEIYYIERTKEGGAKQSGTVYGFRLGYDYIKRYKFYGGIDFLWARGTLDGKIKDDRLKSIFTDANVEARLGYTFQSKCWRCASFTPFVGYGYFWEDNFFKHPSPLPIHFKNRFSYVPFGFLSQIFITPTWSIGANLKIRYLIDSEVQASHDPEHNDTIQHYDERLQYRAEIPVTYFVCWNKHSLAVSVVPFYEYRPYGHRANFPFDFLETNLKLYGATVKFLYLF